MHSMVHASIKVTKVMKMWSDFLWEAAFIFYASWARGGGEILFAWIFTK